jgi:hypothetical protein
MEYEDDGDRRRENHEQICKHAVVSHDGNRPGEGDGSNASRFTGSRRRIPQQRGGNKAKLLV